MRGINALQRVWRPKLPVLLEHTKEVRGKVPALLAPLAHFLLHRVPRHVHSVSQDNIAPVVEARKSLALLGPTALQLAVPLRDNVL